MHLQPFIKREAPAVRCFCVAAEISHTTKTNAVRPSVAYWQDLLGNEYLHQSCVATGRSSMERRPQLVVLRIRTSSSVQEDLHHLFVVIDATLREREDGMCLIFAGVISPKNNKSDKKQKERNK